MRRLLMLAGVLLVADFCHGEAMNAEVRLLRRVKRELRVISCASTELTPLAGGGWRYTLPKANLPPADVVEIAVPFLTARKGDAGFWVLPDGRMGAFTRDNGECRIRNCRIPLPFAGFRSPRGSWMAIVRGLRFQCDFGVAATNGLYELVTRFHLADLARPAYEDGVVEFVPLKPDADGLADMARLYREERLARGDVKPLAERVKGNKELAYTAESIFVRVKHGYKFLNTQHEEKKKWAHQSVTNEPPIQCVISFDQFKDIMRRMKEIGVDRAEVCSVGGTAGGFDGRFPDILPIPEEFGGEKKLREAIAYGKSLGYQMVTHFATTAMFECSQQWNPDDLCLRPDGTRLKGGIVAGGQTYRLCPKVYVDRFIKRDWEIFRDLGYRGTHHIDVISCITPYQCFNPKHSLNSAESAKYLRQIGDYSRQVFGGFGSEAGFDWMAPSLDFALYVSWFPGAKNSEATPLVDRVVPLWQLVYHGIIVSNPFYATIDGYIDRSREKKNYSDDLSRFGYLNDSETRILKIHEFGGRPVFYYTLYADVTPLKRACDDYRKFSHLQFAFMEDHRELAADVYLTRYSNGEETVTNYSKEPFAWNGGTVAPRAIELFKTEK